MRHFKYPFTKSINKKLHIKRIGLLDKSARQRYISNRLFISFIGVSYWVLFFLFFISMILIEKTIEPMMGKTLYTILNILISLIMPLLILIYPYIKFEKKYPRQFLEPIPRELISTVNIKLFQYYKIPESYLVTKCYDCSNPLLIDKDVLLFFHNEKLRMVNDFTSTIKDFGCYEMNLDELDLSYGKNERVITTDIKLRKFSCSLGKRAKSFISRRGISNKSK